MHSHIYIVGESYIFKGVTNKSVSQRNSLMESALFLFHGNFMQMLPLQHLRLSQRLTLPPKMIFLFPKYFLLRMPKIEPNCPAVHASCTIQDFGFWALIGVHMSFKIPRNISLTPIFSKLCLYVLIFLTYEFTEYFKLISNSFYLLISHLFGIDSSFYMQAQEGQK